MRPQWKELYDEHEPRVRSILRKMCRESDVDDLVQECLIKIWSGMHGVRGERVPNAWIAKVTINAVRDHFRRIVNQLRTEEFDEERMPAIDIDGQISADRELVYGALGKLSSSHREVLILYVIEEKAIDEISEELRVPPGTVKSRLYHARENLRAVLKKMGMTSQEDKGPHLIAK